MEGLCISKFVFKSHQNSSHKSFVIQLQQHNTKVSRVGLHRQKIDVELCRTDGKRKDASSV